MDRVDIRIFFELTAYFFPFVKAHIIPFNRVKGVTVAVRNSATEDVSEVAILNKTARVILSGLIERSHSALPSLFLQMEYLHTLADVLTDDLSACDEQHASLQRTCYRVSMSSFLHTLVLDTSSIQSELC